MKTMLLAAALTFACGSNFAYAEQTAGEQVKETAKDAKRAVKKGAHRVGEKMCMESDAECLAKKAKNRAIEAKDAVKDKGSEVKDHID